MSPEIKRLGVVLSKLIDRAEQAEETTIAIHFFTIKYATHLDGLSRNELLEIIKIARPNIDGTGWVSEIQKSLKLAKYVSITQEY